jgi:arylsulfatase A-like enzyme
VTAPVQLHDIAATVLSAAGVDFPWNLAEAGICGRDLLPLARGETASVRRDTVNLYRNTGINRTSRDWDPPLHASMLLDDSYKLSIFHGNHEGHPAGELYDVTRDPHELNNLWSDPAAAEVKTDMIQRLLDWLVRNEITYLGSRGGTAAVKPEEFISNTIDPNRN